MGAIVQILLYFMYLFIYPFVEIFTDIGSGEAKEKYKDVSFSERLIGYIIFIVGYYIFLFLVIIVLSMIIEAIR